MHLLEKSINNNVEKLVFASTSSVYGHTQGIVDETHECNPLSPYAFYRLKAEKKF